MDTENTAPEENTEDNFRPHDFHVIFDFFTKEGLKGSIGISANSAEELEVAIEKWKAVQSRVNL